VVAEKLPSVWVDRERRLLDDTVVLYTSDNGFALGEHGLIDKRTAYEASMRVPLLAHWPGAARARVSEMVANIDIAPSVLELAGLEPPGEMHGRSFVPLVEGRASGAGAGVAWRQSLLYEYFWERNFPQTPTIHAVRGPRYKFIRYHGVWDTDELFDLEADPGEIRNLITSAAHKEVAATLRDELFDLLAATGGGHMPLLRDRGGTSNQRSRAGSGGGRTSAPFPPHLIRASGPTKPTSGAGSGSAGVRTGARGSAAPASR
jgi:N-acetylglucosamine-6-sulfatase